MKTRFSTYDIVCTVTELQKYVGMRVNNIYDIDNRTYLLRLQKTEEKCVLLLESGNRMHTTNFEWPKNVAPSGFTMKLRKHLKNKRLESLAQLGTDRIIDLQFGTGEAAYHVIMEMYDKGNILLLDHEFTILNVLRPHTEGDKFRFAVREKYPQNRARETGLMTRDELMKILKEAKTGDQLKKVLMPHLEYGPAVIEHVLLKQGFTNSAKVGKIISVDSDVDRVLVALAEAEAIFEDAKKAPHKGYIIQKKEERLTNDNLDSPEKTYLYSNQEFHPMLFQQHISAPHKEFDSFSTAVDEFFSSLESQKLELKALQQEREALKKLMNVRKDHDQRMMALEKTQEVDKQKAELIMRNQALVNQAIMAVQSALATQISWNDLADLIKESATGGDVVAQHITGLKLETNHISLYLTDPYDTEENDSDNSENEEQKETATPSESKIPAMTVDIDLALSTFANARRYYDLKRHAANKQQKTIESQVKAFKNAEKKTKQALKDVQTTTNINKARKIYWFEKFFWFISSENYLVIAGRDQQQNEMIVKRYMKTKDVYVHADVHGASSVIIKNPSGEPVPPKTLNEAGVMAICYSVAWDAKVVTNSYWVWGEQVSKKAPTGEYLSTGSFMIRGKKNFLPLSHLVLGLSFLFKLEESCVERHKDERRVLAMGEDDAGAQQITEQKLDKIDEQEIEVEIPSDESDDGEHDDDDDEGKSNRHSQLQKEMEEENAENESDDKDEDDEEKANDKSKFPDTHIKIQHFGGIAVGLVVEPTLNDTNQQQESDDENLVYLGDDKPIILKSSQQQQRSRGNSESKAKQQPKTQQLKKEEKEDSNKSQLRRRQKAKLKKIKEKYKDQDDEERELRMNILKSAGTAKESNRKNKKNKKGQQNSTNKPKTNPHQQATQQKKNERVMLSHPETATQEVADELSNLNVAPHPQDDIEDEEPTQGQDELDMINSLTGLPLAEDELLFAVPVVAPYNTLANYKFKVKFTPGTSRRGKAARTAVQMFLKDRSITPREKDLLKAVKDEQLARNLPGKVKLSAPKLQMLRK